MHREKKQGIPAQWLMLRICCARHLEETGFPLREE
jgi:hypothetical protein